MSTRCSLKHERDEATGQGFHLYDDLADERDCVMLELEGLTFETSVSFAPSGRLETRILVRIPKRFARALGLIADSTNAVKRVTARQTAKEEKARRGSGTAGRREAR